MIPSAQSDNALFVGVIPHRDDHDVQISCSAPDGVLAIAKYVRPCAITVLRACLERGRWTVRPLFASQGEANAAGHHCTLLPALS
jgi:hypothetical protein